MRTHTAVQGGGGGSRRAAIAASYLGILGFVKGVRILLYVCPIYVSAYYYICVYICVRILLYMCPIYVSAYYYIASVLGGSRRAAVAATHLGIWDLVRCVAAA